MRSVNEMLRAAHSIRNRLLSNNIDPGGGVFFCTPDEFMALNSEPNMVRLRPWDPTGEVSRFCGLRIMVMDGKAHCGHEPLLPGSTMEMREPRLFRCVICGVIRELL